MGYFRGDLVTPRNSWRRGSKARRGEGAELVDPWRKERVPEVRRGGRKFRSGRAGPPNRTAVAHDIGLEFLLIEGFDRDLHALWKQFGEDHQGVSRADVMRLGIDTLRQSGDGQTSWHTQKNTLSLPAILENRNTVIDYWPC